MSRADTHLETKSNRWLILVPTQLELEKIRKHWPSDRLGGRPNHSVVFELVGFGPIIPAARTVQLISEYQPGQVLLLGIAGWYSDECVVGEAIRFAQVACYGVGVGSGPSFQTAAQLGWDQWAGVDHRAQPIALDRGSQFVSRAEEAKSRIGDYLELVCSSESPETPAAHQDGALLLTTPAASDNEQEVSDRLSIFPNAMAEDMEGFAVAAACRLAGVPLSIVRGISNRAGDRKKSNWRIDEALKAATHLGCQVVSE